MQALGGATVSTGSDRPEVRVLVDEAAWQPTSVFGGILTMRHQYEAFETLKGWGYWARPRNHDVHDRYQERDQRLVRAAGRWHGDPLRPPASGRFVPGDVAAIRQAAVGWDLVRRARQRLERLERGETMHRTTEEHAVALDTVALEWLYDATPYFVDLSTLVGLVDTDIPDDDDLDQLDLPEAVAIYFGGDIAVPMELVEADRSLHDLDARSEAALRSGRDWVSADDHVASVITAPAVTIRRRAPLRVCGVVLHATAGRLDDLMMWLTAQPENTDAQRSIVYGWRSRSSLAYVAVNLAAAVAWGQWQIPELGRERLGDDPASADFRETLRRGWFRRREPAGGALGVRVLDVARTIQRTGGGDGGGTHASPITHRRRRHWRRQRVGPRDGWHYERRLIEPVIVNPGHRPIGDELTIYRLPLPPPPNARQA